MSRLEDIQDQLDYHVLDKYDLHLLTDELIDIIRGLIDDKRPLDMYAKDINTALGTWSVGNRSDVDTLELLGRLTDNFKRREEAYANRT
jgi:hypothetical protein